MGRYELVSRVPVRHATTSLQTANAYGQEAETLISARVGRAVRPKTRAFHHRNSPSIVESAPRRRRGRCCNLHPCKWRCLPFGHGLDGVNLAGIDGRRRCRYPLRANACFTRYHLDRSKLKLLQYSARPPAPAPAEGGPRRLTPPRSASPT
jgi:hypothetical protein